MYISLRRAPVLTTVFILCIISSHAFGQMVNVTFQVDMSKETVHPAGVHVAGDFQSEAGFGNDWQPSATPLSDPDQDGIFTTTVSVPRGNYLFKYINGDSWSHKPELPSFACAESDGGGNFNRPLQTGNADRILPVVVFDSCNAIVRFQVNMSEAGDVQDDVFVSGDFLEAAGFGDNWAEDAIRMEDSNRDGTFEASVEIPIGEYHYTFANGQGLSERDILPQECSTPVSAGRARFLEVSEGANSTPVYCFGTCEVCDPKFVSNYETRWWNDAVFYEIFVRSFYDSDGDGIGDFKGMTERLDYLNDGDPDTDDDLGITGIWLMPTLESPSYHGYDVTDYYAPEPDYGSMEDFEEFLDAAHERGIKVIIDFVMNHCSNEHPWFTQSAANENGYRDWFIWESENPGFDGPWGQPVWHQRGGDYYYGLFWSGMPDLNYDNPEVKASIFDAARFWLEKGVDGFRLDAIKYLDENGTILENTPETFTILEEFNELYKSINPEAITVGEVWSSTSSIIPYIQEDRIDICFDFDLAAVTRDAINQSNPDIIRAQMSVIQDLYPRLQYATFLTNHDIDRIFDLLGRSPSKMKQGASLYLTMPGVPFVYYGEEVGMLGSGPDPNKRRPMQWTSGPGAGFSINTPWQSPSANYLTNNVEDMRDVDGSILEHYKDLIHLRNRSEALRKGYLLMGETEDDMLGYARIFEEEAVLILSSFASIPSTYGIRIPASSLPEGTYRLRDAFTGEQVEMIEVDDQGGLNWAIGNGGQLVPRETRVFTLEQTTSSTEHPSAKRIDFRVYPNPGSGVINVTYQPGTDVTGLVLLDSGGKPVRSWTGREIRYDVSGLVPGLYFLKLQSSDGNGIQPVFIAK